MNFHHKLYMPRIVFVAFIFSLMTACAQFGVPKPQNTEQSMAYTYAGFTAAYQTIGDLRMQRTITSEKRTELVTQVDQGYTALLLADDALTVGNVAGAKQGLDQAKAILATLTVILNEYAKTKGNK